MREKEHSSFRLVAILFVCFALLLSCDGKGKYAGIYKSERQEPTKQKEIILELNESGDGLWKVASDKGKDTFDEVRFVWYIKRGELRINTEEGGVIVGKIDDDTIRITLPNSRTFTFRKQQ